MNELKIFENPEFGKVRTVAIDGEPWLVGKDVARALAYKDSVNALKAHVDQEDKKGGWQITTPSGVQTMTIINESGMYSLIFSSKLPKAKEFKRWVTHEVLPAIRKSGTYSMVPTQPQPVQFRALTSDDYITAARLVSDCRNERLPYVLGFLERGGFDIPQVDAVAPKPQAVMAVQKTMAILNLEDFL